MPDAAAAKNATLNRAGIGTWEWDLTSDTFSWDALFSRFMGLGEEPATRRAAGDMLVNVLDEDRILVREQMTSTPDLDFACQLRVKHADGAVHHIALVGTRQEGLVDGIIQSVDQLHEYQRKDTVFRTIVSSALSDANLGLWTWNPATNMLTWDSGLHRLFKVAIGAFKGNLGSMAAHVHAEDSESFRNWMTASREFGINHQSVLEFRIIHPDSSVHWVRSIMRVIDNPYGSGIYAFGTVQLIDEQRERENDLMRSNRDLEQFAYIASHDLQEPLRNVAHFIQKLCGSFPGELTADQQRFLEHVNRGVDRMHKMIRGLLEFSRIDKRGDVFTWCDLRSVLLCVQEDLHMLLVSRSGRLDIDGVPAFRLCADRAQLSSLFMNLVQNAVKYTRSDMSPHIEISAEKQGNHILIRIKDNGIGIDERHWTRIFFTFKQLDPANRSDGVGIGLTICQRIAQRHGGSVRVESSTPGRGTTFLVTLPENRRICEEDT